MIKYLEHFLALVERFVVAHELLAAAKTGSVIPVNHNEPTDPEKNETASNGSAEDAPATRNARTRNRAQGAASNNEPEPEQEAPARGTRSRTRGAGAGAAEPEAAAEPQRRPRRNSQPEAPKVDVSKDTPEQADDRAELESLLQMAGDVDAAAEEAKEYLAKNNWSTGLDVPADSLIDALNELNDIIDAHFGK